MTSPAVSAGASETLATAAKRMSDHKVGSVVVLDGARLIGILTERDLLRAGATAADPNRATVGAFMTPDPDWVHPDVEAIDAWRSFAEHGYRHVPVVVGDEVKGVVSLRDLVRVSQLRPVDGVFTDVPRGLEGVVAAETAVGSVRGMEGFFHYRQYDATELARKRSFEDVWQLLFDGELPEAGVGPRLAADVAQLAELPQQLPELLPRIVAASPAAAPLDQLRTAVSLLGAAEGMRATRSSARPRCDGTRSASSPRFRRWRPRSTASARELHRFPLIPASGSPPTTCTCSRASGRTPSVREQSRGISSSRSTTASTPPPSRPASSRRQGRTWRRPWSRPSARCQARCTEARRAARADTLDAIGTPEHAEEFIRAAVASGDRIMGFGHRVYRTTDPRQSCMKETARELGGPLVSFAERVEETVVRVLHDMKPDRQLYTNVEFFAGVVMELCGIPREMFTPTFAVSRAVGWCAHILEQVGDNRIIRPSSRYVGPPPPQPVPAVLA